MEISWPEKIIWARAKGVVEVFFRVGTRQRPHPAARQADIPAAMSADDLDAQVCAIYAQLECVHYPSLHVVGDLRISSPHLFLFFHTW